MKSKTLLTWGVSAAMALGLGVTAVPASAQDQDNDLQRATLAAMIARESAMAGVEEAMSVTRAQIAAAVAQATSAVNDRVSERVMEKVSERLQAALAKSRAMQDQAVALANQDGSQTHVVINGEDFSPVDETGWLGVTPDDVSADRAKELKLSSARGVYVSDVEKDSPAEKAGLKSGVVITEFNGEHLEGVVQFRRLVRETPPGHSVSITVWRDGRSQTLNATLGSMSDQFHNNFNINVAPMIRNFQDMSPNWVGPGPAPRGTARAYSFTMPDGDWNIGQGFGSGAGNSFFTVGRTPIIGIQAQDVSGQLGAYFGAPDGEGVLVTAVNSGTPAEKAGIKAGDVITKVEGERVKTLSEMQMKLREKRDAKTVQITVIRKGSETTLTVEPNQPKPAAPRARTRPA